MAKAKSILEALCRSGITDLIGLPDNSSAALFALLKSSKDPVVRMVTREGEAFAMAAGLWVGGRTPAVLVQNTGFLESGDSFRGTVMRMRIPLLCLITYRGYSKMLKVSSKATQEYGSQLLSRPDLDSAALITIRTLQAWGLPFDYLHTEDDVCEIASSIQETCDLGSPVALLVTQDMT